MEEKDRTILHCDMNSFFCSVELLDHPELLKKPVAVAGSEDSRHGIILAKNQIAKKYGIETAEPIYFAMKKCPDLVLLDPHREKYSYYCRTINQIYLSYTDLVEPFSIDESWLDVTGSLKLFQKTGKELADEIRRRVFQETGLTLSAGVSFNKTFAKMCSDYKKPDATTEITRENYQQLLWPLPAGDLFFVGKATADKLATMNIKTIGAIARADEELLARAFGKHGLSMKRIASGIDPDPVHPYDEKREIKSVGNGITFRRDLVSEDDVRTAVSALADRVSMRLRSHGLRCKGVKVDIKNPQFVTISRQTQLSYATDLSSDLFRAVMELFAENWYYGNPIRLITVTAINLTQDAEAESAQLSIFDGEEGASYDERQKHLETAVDHIRSRFGKNSIIKGGLVHNDLGIVIDKE